MEDTEPSAQCLRPPVQTDPEYCSECMSPQAHVVSRQLQTASGDRERERERERESEREREEETKRDEIIMSERRIFPTIIAVFYKL